MSFFFFNDTATTEIYTPFPTRRSSDLIEEVSIPWPVAPSLARGLVLGRYPMSQRVTRSLAKLGARSEEHTSELQSRQYLVCRLLLEKKRIRDNEREVTI